MAEKNHIQSPYIYAANNPILFIDWLGLDPVYNWDKGRYEDNGKEVDWNYVSNWITENNGGVELWNSEKGLQTDNFSSAFGFYDGIPFAELGFGNAGERQYVRTYLVGESNMGTAFGNNSPFSQTEQKDIFLQYANMRTSKTSNAVLGLTLGIPIAIIGGGELAMAAPFIYAQMNMLLNAAGHQGAKACLAGNQAMYQAWTWLNYSNSGAWVGAVGSAVAPEGIGMPYKVNPVKETAAKSVKYLIDIFKNEKKK